MNVIREIQRLNAAELSRCIPITASWHYEYLCSPTANYIFIGGIDSHLNEGDLICVFSQYGEVVDFHLIRDDSTGKHRGFAFLAYEDKLSTILAIDNFNGVQIGSKILRVDHADKYRRSKSLTAKAEAEDRGGGEGGEGRDVFDAFDVIVGGGRPGGSMRASSLSVWDHSSHPIATESVSETLSRIRSFADGAPMTELAPAPTSISIGRLRATMHSADVALKRVVDEKASSDSREAKEAKEEKKREGTPSVGTAVAAGQGGGMSSSHLSHIAQLLEQRRREREEADRRERMGIKDTAAENREGSGSQKQSVAVATEEGNDKEKDRRTKSSRRHKHRHKHKSASESEESEGSKSMSEDSNESNERRKKHKKSEKKKKRKKE